MSLAQQAVQDLKNVQDYFNRSTRNLGEDLSTFSPAEGVMTSAQQIAHAAHTVGWFIEGGFRPEGFDLNFEEHGKIVNAYTSVAAAKAWFDKEIEAAIKVISAKTDEELMAPIAAGMIMGGAPRMAMFGAISDHTAHHRGALAVYARLIGKVPPMPYM